MEQNLKDIYVIQRTLESSGYYDISRISKEIEEYSRKKNIFVEEILKRISNREPWEYICGETEFCGYRFQVSKSTLIPRIETEDMVGIAYKIITQENDIKTVIDVGTGSGCIIISLLKKIGLDSSIRFVATDISEKALVIAKRNSTLQKVSPYIEFVKTNLLEDVEISDKFLIIANLPYVPTQMYEKLDSSVKDFEPKIAIDGGKDGLVYYKELLKHIEEELLHKQNGKLLLEIEPSTFEDLKKIIPYKFELIKDFRNQDRFVLIHLA